MSWWKLTPILHTLGRAWAYFSPVSICERIVHGTSAPRVGSLTRIQCFSPQYRCLAVKYLQRLLVGVLSNWCQFFMKYLNNKITPLCHSKFYHTGIGFVPAAIGFSASPTDPTHPSVSVRHQPLVLNVGEGGLQSYPLLQPIPTFNVVGVWRQYSSVSQ